MRTIRPGVKLIVLAPSGTPEDAIAALRARVFLYKSAPFDTTEIAEYAARAATAADSLQAIDNICAPRLGVGEGQLPDVDGRPAGFIFQGTAVGIAPGDPGKT